jgi:hypothetical protein
MHAKMNAEHRAAFERLLPLTPTNIHLKTNATYGQHADFETIWFKHSPTAARYYLFASLWKGDLSIYDEHDGKSYQDDDSSTELSDSVTSE